MENQNQYNQPRQDINQGYNRPGYTLRPIYRQPTNLYQQANRDQYSVQQISPYQGQQQQQSTCLTADHNPAIPQCPAKLAKDFDIKPYVQQHNQPAAYYSQQEKQQHDNIYVNNSYNTPTNHQQEEHYEDFNANHIEVSSTINCQICQQLFLSNNALHRHLQSTCQALKQFKDPKKAKSATVMYAKPKKEVIKASTAPKTNDLPRYKFCR